MPPEEGTHGFDGTWAGKQTEPMSDECNYKTLEQPGYIRRRAMRMFWYVIMTS
jgi:hypothetical protein